MEETIDESFTPKSTKAISLSEEKEYKSYENCICKIIAKSVGTGFFCKIEYEGNLVPVLITNYHVIDDEYMEKNNKLNYYINKDLNVININIVRNINSTITNNI